MTIPGLHHVTAIASDPQTNLDFYTGVLGLRLVKLTVNFDDPGTYHFYYGDHAGTPGSILTFFPWPGASRGRQGASQVTEVSFAVPKGAIDHWAGKLAAQPDAEGRIRFHDPDGLALSILAQGDGSGTALERIAEVTLTETDSVATKALVENTMGISEGVRIAHAPGARRGLQGAGTVHHVAFRAEDDAIQLAWQQRMMQEGLHVTEVLDRDYFHSIYFREPGGVLFEIATDPPGFSVDESLEELGTHLKLPHFLEPRRAEIERRLPPLRLPGVSSK